MMPASEIKTWLSKLEPNAPVHIDDGGLTLVSGDAYLEVGGEPDEEEDEPEEDDE